MRIRHKINLYFLSIFVLLLVVLGIVVTYYSFNTVRRQITTYLSASSRARAEHIRTFLHDQQDLTLIMASAPIYRDFLKDKTGSATYAAAKDRVEKRLLTTVQTDDSVYESFLLNDKGVVVASSDPTQEGTDKKNDPYFTEGKKGYFVKDVYYSETLKKLTYATAAPVKDGTDGKLLGVSVMRYNPTKFYNVVKNENGLGDTEENFIINKDKYFITPSRFLGDAVVLQNKVETKNATDCFDQKEVNYIKKNGYTGLREYVGPSAIVESLDYRNVQIVGTHAYIPETGWCLITKVDKSELYKPTRTLLIILGSIFALATAIFFAASYFVARKITGPILALNKGAKDITEGNYDVRVAQKADDEIGDLSRTFDEMTKELLESRKEVDKKVEEQTKEIIQKEKELEDQKKAILNVLSDVQDEKKNLEKLTDDLQKFQMAVEGASDHIVITDPDGIVLFANQGVTRITGFSVDEVIGKKAGSKELWGGQMPIGIYQDLWKTIKEKKKPFVGVFDNVRKNGTKYEAAATVTPILNNKGEVSYFVGIERDVTKEKEIDRAKTEFVSLASHQLRTPLSAINWYAEMLINGDAGKITKDQKEYLGEIYHGNQRMVELVNSLLNVSRLDLGTFEIDPKPVSVCDVVEDVANEMKHSIEEKKQTLTQDCPKDVPKVKADPKLLRVIIQNLLSNAVKYTPEKGKLSVALKYNAKDPKDTYVITVADSGYGIPESQKDKIFTKLFRADNVRAMDTEGTGLGLYIIKAILDEAGGTIAFQSKENKGTTFTVTLPKTGMKQKSGNKSID